MASSPDRQAGGGGKKSKGSLDPALKKLSKSALTKSLDRLGGSGGGGGSAEDKERSGGKTRGDKSSAAARSREKPTTPPEPPREVTIAKLGPFKMSLELRDQGNPARAAAANSNGGGGGQEKSSSAKSRRRKSGVTGRETGRRKSEAASKEVPAPESQQLQQQKIPKIKREKSRDKDSSATGSADKIIVSKLVKSDRPRRDKSPEKWRTDSSSRVSSSDDYRLTLNKRGGGGGDTDNSKENTAKFRRSVSQPNPPPDFKLNELIPADLRGDGTDSRTAAGGGRRDRKTQRTVSVNSDRVGAVNRKQLRRSSTTREPEKQQQQQQQKQLSPVERSSTLRPTTSVGGGSGVHVFDNLGFDKSPDLRRQRKPSSNSQLSELREQLETQLRREKAKQAASVSSYSLMEATSISESDSGDDKRKSPPTQTQSLR